MKDERNQRSFTILVSSLDVLLEIWILNLILIKMIMLASQKIHAVTIHSAGESILDLMYLMTIVYYSSRSVGSVWQYWVISSQKFASEVSWHPKASDDWSPVYLTIAKWWWPFVMVSAQNEILIVCVAIKISLCRVGLMALPEYSPPEKHALWHNERVYFER